MSRPFLTARWENLVMRNYVVDPAWLRPLVPRGTELDLWHGKAFVSLVGFFFVNTRVRGVPVPFHRNFEEVNLRFYVRRNGPDGELRRGVVFIKELVPRAAIAAVARWLYNEPYVAVPMGHAPAINPATGGRVAYTWQNRHRRFSLSATVMGEAQPLQPGSSAEFITEHHWGYTRQRDGGTLEYRVTHPSWLVWTAASHAFESLGGDSSLLYGKAFGETLAGVPESGFVAVGSEVCVFPGQRIA